MLIKKVINEKFLKVIFAGFVSYYFAQMFLQPNFQAPLLFVLAIFAIIFLIRIEYAFYFLLTSRGILEIFYIVEAIEGTRMTHLVSGLISFLLLYYIIVIYRHNIFSLDINKIYGIFLIVSIPAIFLSPLGATYDGIKPWFKLLQGFTILNITILVVLSAGSELYKKRMNIICWCVLISFSTPYVLFLKNIVQGTVRGGGEYERYATFFAHYNAFSYLLLIALTFCLFLYSVTIRDSKKILWLISIGILIITVYVTYTRNVWLGLATLLIAWNFFRKNFISTFSVIGFIVLLLIFNPTVQDRLNDVYIVLTADSFFELAPTLGSGRIGILQQNIRYFITHSTLIQKLLGNGFGIAHFVGFSTRSGISLGEHNSYLVLLMNTGIIGLFTYLLYILKLFQESFKLLRRTKEIYFRNLAQVFIALLFSYLVINLFDHMIWNTTFQYYFSVFAGLLIAANIIDERNKNNEKKDD